MEVLTLVSMRAKMLVPSLGRGATHSLFGAHLELGWI